MDKILVTGGAGFIGSNFVHRALARGDEVTVYDALTYAGNPANLAGLDGGDGYRFVHGDVCDGGALTDAMPGHDAVVTRGGIPVSTPVATMPWPSRNKSGRIPV